MRSRRFDFDKVPTVVRAGAERLRIGMEDSKC
jgi:hypothetical protein